MATPRRSQILLQNGASAFDPSASLHRLGIVRTALSTPFVNADVDGKRPSEPCGHLSAAD